MYHDDLVPEIYDDWILSRRVALREKFLHALARVAEHAEQIQDYHHAFEFFHRLAFADPLNEDAQRGLMRVYARLGRHAAALQQYDQLAQLLADELGVEPLPETRALAEAIRDEHHARGADHLAEKPFVGRQRERARLIELVERAQSGRGGLAFVEGEAGIGKTRLLESVAEGAAWRGVTVVWGRARELTGITPFAPLDEAWRAACAGPRVEQLRARLAPALCHALAGLEPRLRTAAPSANPPNVADALAEGVRALADLAPHLFILDDVQWADASFWNALEKLAPQIAAQRVCLILAYRTDEVRANEIAWRALRDLDRECAPLRLTLNGLSATECAELAHALGQSLDDPAARALQQRTNGNPLFAQALLQGESADQASYTELIERRLARLSPAARAALEAGAVLGREFTHGAWQALAGADVLTAIPVLITEHFIDETANGYSFEHDLTRELIYRAMNRAHLRELHRRVGVVLAQEHAEPSVLAWHFEQGEDWTAVVRALREAGDRAAQGCAYQAAGDLYTRALNLTARLAEPAVERLRLLARRQRVFITLARVSDLRADRDEIERLVSLLKDSAARLEVLETRLNLGILNEDVLGTLTTGEQAVEWARHVGDLTAETRVHTNLGAFLADSPGRPQEAIAHLERAVELAQRLRDDALTVEVLAQLAYAEVRAERCILGLAHAQRALDLATRPELVPQSAHAWYALGAAKWYLAEWEDARVAMQTARRLYRESGNWRAWADVTFDLAIVASAMGQHAEARRTLDALITFEEQAEVDPQSSSRMWANAISARLYLWAGDVAAAEQMLDRMKAWMETAEATEPLVTALIERGRLRLAQGRPQDALAPLQQAIEISANVLKNVDTVALLLHTLAAQHVGDHATAQTSWAHAEQALRESDAARHNVLRYYTHYVVSGAHSALKAARDEIYRQASLFTDETLRADFLNHVLLHREIEAQWQALHPAPPRVTVRLARADTPLGRALTDADFVTVQWTVDAGEEDAALLQREGKVALRRHRLARLLREAREQNAAPTDGDLARALGVNIRTVERDMAVLRAAGHQPKTRKRK